MLELTKERVRSASLPVARALARAGISANFLTVLGAILNGIVALVIIGGQVPLAGILLWAVNILDVLDGAVARATSREGRFGAFLDSLLDRYSDAVVFLGLLYWYVASGQLVLALLVYVAAMGSMLVSYARARAEGLGAPGAVGLLQRAERIVLLGLGLLGTAVHPVALPVALTGVAVLTHFTVLQRLLHVARAR